MKNKIIYSFILVFLISVITSAKKTTDCNAAACCKINKQNVTDKKVTKENKPDLSSMSLFFFNI